MVGQDEWRTARRYRCQWCGEPFHANKGGKKLFCGNPCRAAFNSHRHKRLRELQEAASNKAMTPRKIVAGLAALHVQPALWDETMTEATS
ncbi:hypothetical protein [Agromyces sp. ZXT2-3]|uniref:hypothetical protein n=1 Tax=Agromyces sp. ZXT2-3 TaxID=3461152 RepID=UPI00405500D8